MNKNLQEELFKKYPKIFRQKTIKSSPLHNGIQCEDGWFDLIDAVCESISLHIKFENKKADERFKKKITLVPSRHCQKLTFEFSQIKSKFDRLRFYFDGGDDYTFGVTSMAETMSLKICEHCGIHKSLEASFGCEKCRKN